MVYSSIVVFLLILVNCHGPLKELQQLVILYIAMERSKTSPAQLLEFPPHWLQ